uniref:Protein kinase domain-containing protein n=1 Tax=Oryza glaberrima TaxID=4538 RepID=I1R2U6_ORYGL
MRNLLLLPLLVAVAATVPLAAALSADGVALLAFKTAVTDDPSGALSSWSDADDDPCRWAGVTCANTSSSGPRVVGVAVAGKNLSGYVPSVLGSLALLRRLNLHGNRLSGTVPPALANATSLHSLFLYGNSLTGGLPPELCDLPRLQNLDLSDNSLTGSLPPELRRCKQLQRLMLSGNGFSGEIPAGVWPEMVSLQLLDLSDNSLTGAIPPELGKLAALAGMLNLSRNHLSGGVPPELGHLPATVTLDLRFNNLSGEIPQSGSLASQGPTAFLNNPGLCGFPLQVPCRAAPPSSSTPPPPSAAGSISGAGRPRQPIKTSLIVLISVADAAGVALIGVIVVYIYWKLRDRRGDGCGGDGDDDEEGKRGLFPCPCMRADDSSDDGSDDGDDVKRNNTTTTTTASGGGGGGEEGQLVAIDKGFKMELDELLRSSAYVLGKGGKGVVYKVVVGNGTTPVAVRRLGGGAAAAERYKEFAAEAGAIGRVRHPNVVRLRAYYWSADEKLVVTDFVNNGNLATALRGEHTPSPSPSPSQFVNLFGKRETYFLKKWSKLWLDFNKLW